MSISLESSVAPGKTATKPRNASEEKALEILRQNSNPFESLARPQRADESFHDLHVPELQEFERGLLLQIIDWYRVNEYQDSRHLKPTRVVTIRGDRGSGKTHLVQSLIARADRKPQVIVRPAFFDPNLPFEEYLLSQLKTSLNEEDEFHRDRPMAVIARAITRRLLIQAIRGLNPVQKLFAFSPKGIAKFAMLTRGGERLNKSLNGLCESLAKPESGRDLPHSLVQFGLDRGYALRLIDGHLKQHEIGADPLLNIRRRLYQSMARAVLLEDNDELANFLGGEYVKVELPGKIARFELVGRLLHALIEASALVRMPVVFVFDNLERLLSPLSSFDEVLARAFVRSLAQAVDNVQGIVILLFAEGGLFSTQVAPQMDEFVRGRLDQGVPVPSHGPVHLVDLKYPSTTEIGKLIQSRVGRLLGDLANTLPSEFPFDREFVDSAIGTGSSNLRNVLYRLRDEYNLLVYGPSNGGNPPPPLPPPCDWPRLVESSWSRALQATRREIEATSQQELHACLGTLLEYAIPHTVELWTLHKVTHVVGVGENPDYGVLTVADWKVSGEAVANHKGPKSLHIAVGLLLASGPGLASDLRAKFDYFHGKMRGHRLVVLWVKESDDLISALPPVTRSVWDAQAENQWRTELRSARELDLRHMLAFPKMLDNLREIVEETAPKNVVCEFLRDRCRRIFELVQPPHSKTDEGNNIDED